MFDKKLNLYGIFVLVLIVITSLSIITSSPSPTGFTVEGNKCFDGTSSGQCSVLKPKYCDNGAFKSDCQRCGCSESEACQSDGSCLLKCSDETPFGHCSENKPLLCFKGSLVENCFECGCIPGQSCLRDGTCSGTVEVGAGAKVKKELIKESSEKLVVSQCIDGNGFGQCSHEKPKYCETGNLVDNCGQCGCNSGDVCNENICYKKSDAGLWWNLFCKVLYYNEYEDCISDAIRYKNRNK
jgi:hypothetical protein